MGVWDARKDPSEKVFFLFAVNGSKSYCALAEMKGRYDTDGHIEGWRGSGHKGYALTSLQLIVFADTNYRAVSSRSNGSM